jgi:hypothetical protein
MVCWTGQHLKFAFTCALPILVLLVIGVPAVFFKFLNDNKKMVEEFDEKSKLQGGELTRL